MNSKQKAEELFNKMYNCELDISYYGAKQCALIAVDEIIAQIEPSVSMDVISARINYWEEVKKEIELL
jgi:hypothetical protein